jgi:hypothetical protein
MLGEPALILWLLIIGAKDLPLRATAEMIRITKALTIAPGGEKLMQFASGHPSVNTLTLALRLRTGLLYTSKKTQGDPTNTK